MQSFLYKDYSSVLSEQLNLKVQKISINAGFTCPNRDGTKGRGGCTYCNNQTFNPDYCMHGESVRQQLEKGVQFFRQKYPNQFYLAYFQAYTNTYAPIKQLIAFYEEALSFPNVVGLVVGTRPDCVNDDLLDYFEHLARRCYVMIEYGIESTCDETLRQVNRGHTFADAQHAIIETALRGIYTAAHLILGLPGESRPTLLSHAKKLSELPVTALKLHQLQLIKGTFMAKQYAEKPELFHLFSHDEYIDLCIDFMELLNPEIAIERFTSQSPPNLLIAPDWRMKNHVFVTKLRRRMQERQTWQGRLF